MFNKSCDTCHWNDGLDCRDIDGQPHDRMDWDDVCPGWKPMQKLIFKKKDFIPFCPYCRGRVEPMDDPPVEWYVCPTHGEIETQDVEMVDAREVDQ